MESGQQNDTPGIPIKQEPVDNEFFTRHSPTAPTNFQTLYGSAHETRRAKDSEGRAFTTQCFESPYSSRPQFHRLRCGHDIVTVEIDICGSNCHPATQYTTTDLKPVFKPFECPHPDCQTRALVAPRKDPKTGRRVLGRPCQLGHVRGRDEEADREWDQQKLELADMVKNTRRINPRYKELVRKTSRSPSRITAKVTTKRPRVRLTTTDTAAELDAGLDEATRTLLVAQKGKHTRRLRKDHLETDTEKGRSDQQRARQGASRKTTSSLIPEDRHPTRSCDACDECGSLLKEELYSCQQCAEADSSYLLCSSCHENAYVSHLKLKPGHRFVLEDVRASAGDRVISDEARRGLNKFCKCQSDDLQYMVPCGSCSKPFHPGCVGMGLQDEVQYTMPEREEFLRADFEHFNGDQATEVVCRQCVALQHLVSGLEQNRRAEMGRMGSGNFLLKYKSKLMSQKRLARERAQSDEDEATVESHFAAIEEEMDACIDPEERHWKALLAKSLRVPLPPPRPQKRDADEMEVDTDSLESEQKTAEATASIPRPQGSTRKRSKPAQNRLAPGAQTYKFGGQMTLAIGSHRKL